MNFPEKKPGFGEKLAGLAPTIGTAVGTGVGAIAGVPSIGAAAGGALGGVVKSAVEKNGTGAVQAAAGGVGGVASGAASDAMARRIDTQNKLAEAEQAASEVIPDAYAQDAIKRRLAQAAFAAQGTG